MRLTLRPERPQGAGQVVSGGLALDRRIGGEDDLAHAAFLLAAQERRDGQLLRSHAVQRVEGAAEDVVQAVELRGGLDGPGVQRILDNADHAAVARRVPAHRAGVFLGDQVARRAVAHLLCGAAHRAREPCRRGRRAQQVLHEPHRGARPDAGKLLELFDQRQHRRRAQLH